MSESLQPIIPRKRCSRSALAKSRDMKAERPCAFAGLRHPEIRVDHRREGNPVPDKDLAGPRGNAGALRSTLVE